MHPILSKSFERGRSNYEKITPATTGKTVRIQLEIQLNPGETLAVDSDSRVEGWVEVISQ